VFTGENDKLTKNTHNLKSQSTDLHKMKGILNSTKLLRRDHCQDLSYTCLPFGYMLAFQYCVFFFFWKANEFFLPKNEKLNVDAQQLSGEYFIILQGC